MVNVLLLFFLVFASTQDNNFKWQICPTVKPWPVAVLNVTVSPSPFKAGDNVTIDASVDITGEINDGEWLLQFKKYGFVVQTEKGENCNECDCPCSGKKDLTLNVRVKPYATHGSYTGSFYVSNAANAKQACVQFTFDL
jgi:hypothetical protein